MKKKRLNNEGDKIIKETKKNKKKDVDLEEGILISENSSDGIVLDPSHPITDNLDTQTIGWVDDDEDDE